MSLQLSAPEEWGSAVCARRRVPWHSLRSASLSTCASLSTARRHPHCPSDKLPPGRRRHSLDGCKPSRYWPAPIASSYLPSRRVPTQRLLTELSGPPGSVAVRPKVRKKNPVSDTANKTHN